MRCFLEFWGVTGGAVFLYCPKAGTSPLNKDPAAVLVILCCAPPGSAAGRSWDGIYDRRQKKRQIMRNYDFFSLAELLLLSPFLGKARVDYEIMRSWQMILDRPSERSKTIARAYPAIRPIGRVSHPTLFRRGCRGRIIFQVW